MTTATTYTIAVRALCEFTAKSGDLDLRFTPSPTAREGIAGHSTVTARRHDDYESEVSVSGEYRELTVRGRADGYDPISNQLEEIKTYRGDLNLMPDNHRTLHWAQAKMYGWLLCKERELKQINIALVYFDVGNQRETVLVESISADELEQFFNLQCQRFLHWAKKELVHRQARDQAMEALTFPYTDFRSGQRSLAEAVYQSAFTGRCLLVEAPTGIGKTLGTLFPVIKALPRKALDKVFFLSAKTPGRALALNALQHLDIDKLRSLELVAREKSCEYPDSACHGESCPLAQGFYDRLPAAREEAASIPMLDQPRLREVALNHRVCPYYLGQEMARWSDVIVGDYNYYFDLYAMLHTLTRANQWKVNLLVDEAHNLVDRARSMYSASLNQIRFRRVKKHAPKRLKSALDKINREWNQLNRAQEAEDYAVLKSLPVAFLGSLQSATGAIMDYLTEHPTATAPDLMPFYFDALHFLRIVDVYQDANYICDFTWDTPPSGRKGSELCLRNLIPAAQLAPRFETAHSATLFSATLRPADYYRDLLGLPDDTQTMEVASPFVAEQLQVTIASNISTRYRDRAASVMPIAELIARQYLARPGNYLAFFSSYQYLNQVLEQLRSAQPELPVWAQARSMNEPAREEFLHRFQEEGQGIGFAVLGGAFSEGIDLPGNRLIGAFVATLGLPQMNPINEHLKERMNERFGDGYNYAYLYPGLSKVVQAAGRVIRTEQDKGVIYLIDDRYHQRRVRNLLPRWWRLQ
ncbi:ATP-dependent DNA helicase [Marinimicrobium sp. ABcell2]|uniref:ATP-dependent DNA helicase n=1 Tax=Marinimicrobium sp. ABcell2 TaxID=3069751 RepID=UPI0027AF1CE3|nr:ATP-dependent DNA helicase [Marinimicrobium sp. ABcell2]MDQ2077827.1 ATP-dependent DNA helicase [Marinimicrobium sp. ABcell2]